MIRDAKDQVFRDSMSIMSSGFQLSWVSCPDSRWHRDVTLRWNSRQMWLFPLSHGSGGQRANIGVEEFRYVSQCCTQRFVLRVSGSWKLWPLWPCDTGTRAMSDTSKCAKSVCNSTYHTYHGYTRIWWILYRTFLILPAESLFAVHLFRCLLQTVLILYNKIVLFHAEASLHMSLDSPLWDWSACFWCWERTSPDG